MLLLLLLLLPLLTLDNVPNGHPFVLLPLLLLFKKKKQKQKNLTCSACCLVPFRVFQHENNTDIQQWRGLGRDETYTRVNEDDDSGIREQLLYSTRFAVAAAAVL